MEIDAGLIENIKRIVVGLDVYKAKNRIENLYPELKNKINLLNPSIRDSL